MKITSYGAAGGVTGSKHLLEINGYRVLLDCGMFQGRRKEADVKNRHLGFEARNVNATVLSHAHIDHSGLLPMLDRNGYNGFVYATCATRDLCSIMLKDSAHIQARDAEWLSKKNREFVPPLYQDIDVQEVMKRFKCAPYGDRFEVVPGVYVTFQDAGHVLGSAIVCVEYAENGSTKRLIFSGDLGRKNAPILRDPWQPDEADTVILESTYGDRDHKPIQDMEEDLAQVIRETHARGGKVIIPSFALERAQEIIYSLKNLESRLAIPYMPVFVDSPLTVNITEVFRMHSECFDAEIQKLMASAGDPFRLHHIRYIQRVEDSIRLNFLKEPAIIIAAAGMCEHGRILHHLKNNVENPDNTVLIVGFQAKHTLGRRIVEKQRELRILGKTYQLNAQVRVLDSFSAHAGKGELVEFGRRFKDCKAKVVLVHGEDTALTALREALTAEGLQDITIQEEGVTISA